MEHVLSSVNRLRGNKQVVVILGGRNNLDNSGRCINFTTELDYFLGEVSGPRIILVGLSSRHGNLLN